MDNLHALLKPLEAHFPKTKRDRERGVWFVFILLSIVVPFTRSVSSNLLRSLAALFDLHPGQRRFYAFMASPVLPWGRLWRTLWKSILAPLVEGRLLLALDDSLNNKSGRSVFGGAFFHDHTAKLNQPEYPWAQNIVAVGLLKVIKGRWAFLPLAFRLYLLAKEVATGKATTLRKGTPVAFRTKLEQAVEMLKEVAEAFVGVPILVVTDSWFGNDGLMGPLRASGHHFALLSRLRANAKLFGVPEGQSGKRGRKRKYGATLGTTDALAAQLRAEAQPLRVDLYGKPRELQVAERIVMLRSLKCAVRVVWVFRETRYVALFTTDLGLRAEQIIAYYGARWKIEAGFKEIKQELGSSHCQARTADAVLNHLNLCMMAATLVWVYADRSNDMPERRHGVAGRGSYAFSDIRQRVAKVALSEQFRGLWPQLRNTPQNGLVSLLLRLVG